MPRIQQECCTNCGGTVQIELMITNAHNSNRVCQPCATVLLFESAFDNEWYPRTMRVRTDEGFMTRYQRDNLDSYTDCSVCAVRVHNDRLRNIIMHDELNSACGYCSDNMPTCDSCMTPLHENSRNHIHVDGGIESRCRECVDTDEEVYMCDHSGCNTYVTQNVGETEDGEYYCRLHTPVLEDIMIWNYTYTPNLNFTSNAVDNTRGKYFNREMPFYGIEIEVDTPDGMQETANKCKLMNADDIYLKRDASIDGFEIVTHPSTFRAQKDFPWTDRLKQLQKNGARGYNSGKCGIHIHVTKTAYSPIVWWKVLMFSYRCSSQWKMFARRNGNYRYCAYTSPSQYENYSIKKTMYPEVEGRYKHINVTENTIEFRMFRSTTDPDRFWATLEFVYSAIAFCEQHGYSFMVNNSSTVIWDEFTKFIKSQNECHTLRKHLKKRNLSRLGINN
jgi:hypothetical protein